MDLRPTDEQQQLRDALRRLFVDRRLAELVAALPDPPQHDPARALADAMAVGLPALGLPEEHSGVGTFADLVVAHEELGRGLAGPLLPALAAAGRLLLHARGGDRDALLTALASGQWTAAPAVNGSPDAFDAVKRGVFAGRDVSDLLVLARDQDNGDAIVVVVPTDSPDLEWQQEPGNCDIPSWTVRLAGVTVPPERQLTLTGHGLDAFRCEVALLAAARQLGGGRAVLERTIVHVRTREQFGRAIGTFQAVQHQLADIATELDAADLAIQQAAWAVDAAVPSADIRRLSAIAALTATATFRRTTLVAHQLHGGMGFVLDSPLHLWSARAVADPTVPLSRRQLLDELCTATGVTSTGIDAPPDHRVLQPN